jgi:hypothetical protein
MRALARELVGRDEELAVVRDFLAAVDGLAPRGVQQPK